MIFEYYQLYQKTPEQAQNVQVQKKKLSKREKKEMAKASRRKRQNDRKNQAVGNLEGSRGGSITITSRENMTASPTVIRHSPAHVSVEKKPVQEDIPTNDQQECPDITTEETIDEKEAEDGLEDTQSDDGSTSSGYNSEKIDLDAKVESPSTESQTSEIEATCSDKAKQEKVTEAVETVFERAQARRIQKQENFKEYESKVQFSQ